MKKPKIFKKGSEWRKWDLHIHTPNSFLNNKYKCDYKTLAEKILEENIAVVGVTNYFIVEEEEITKLEEHLGEDVLLLPNFEFRINDKNKDGDYINIHIIFNPFTTEISKIHECLSRVELNNLAEETKKYCTIENIKQYGAETITVSFDALVEQLNNDFMLFNDYLIVGVNNGYGGFHPDKKPRNIQLALKIDKYSNIILGREQDRNFFLNKPDGQRDKYFSNPKPVIACSDAHTIGEIGGIYTWIKADPTFEGLKQIMFEPEERVLIQKENPTYEYPKPFFSAINFLADEQIFEDDNDLFFDKQSKSIPLNPNLVTIIGGRGEGKSMLTEYISTSFYGKETVKEGVFNKKGNIVVEYSKSVVTDTEKILFPLSNEKHSIDFIYINQGNLKNEVEDREKKSKLANSISKFAKLNKPVFSEELNILTLKLLNKLHSLNNFLSKGENQIEYLQKEEKSTTDFINNITTEENKEKLEKYSKNIEILNSLSAKRKHLLEFEIQITDSIRILNEKIIQINTDTNNIPLIKPYPTSLNEQHIAIKKWLEHLNKEIVEIQKEIEGVKEKFGQVYKGDLTTLLRDIDKFHKSLFLIRKKIEEINLKKQEKVEINNQLFVDSVNRKSIVEQIKEEYINQKEKLIQEWSNFSKVDERDELNPAQKDIMRNLLLDLEIEVIIDFDENKFYNEIYNCINGAVWRIKNNRNAQKEYFKITNIDNFISFLRERYIDAYYNSGIYGDHLTNVLFDEKYRSKYLKVFPILKYQGKDLNKISVGQKGTVYLKMMLATEAFSKPIIFDQPEDDLDNEFIMSNLIELFKQLKKYRQVIIVTHNANLVINADAEQVIIAKNEKGKLQYISGSLENEIINEKICEILEGGKIAFEKRRNKYKYIK